MTAHQILGLFMVAIPVVAFIAWTFWELGLDAFFAWSIVLGAIVTSLVVCLGVFLMVGIA